MEREERGGKVKRGGGEEEGESAGDGGSERGRVGGGR